jgi:hypothetical protein
MSVGQVTVVLAEPGAATAHPPVVDQAQVNGALPVALAVTVNAVPAFAEPGPLTATTGAAALVTETVEVALAWVPEDVRPVTVTLT